MSDLRPTTTAPTREHSTPWDGIGRALETRRGESDLPPIPGSPSREGLVHPNDAARALESRLRAVADRGNPPPDSIHPPSIAAPAAILPASGEVPEPGAARAEGEGASTSLSTPPHTPQDPAHAGSRSTVPAAAGPLSAVADSDPSPIAHCSSPASASLSDADAGHLIALIDAPPQDLAAAAKDLGLTHVQALELLASPAAERYLAGIARLAAVRRDYRADAVREKLTEVLCEIALDKDRDPVERRRAASAGVRALEPWRSTSVLLRCLDRTRDVLANPTPRRARVPSSPPPGEVPEQPRSAASARGEGPSSASPSTRSHTDEGSANSAVSCNGSTQPPPLPPASSFAPPARTVREFIASAGAAPHSALPLVALHKLAAQGEPAILAWLERLHAHTRDAEARPGPCHVDDDTDTAVQHVSLTRPGSTEQLHALIHCVLERGDRGGIRWRISDFALQPDTS